MTSGELFVSLHFFVSRSNSSCSAGLAFVDQARSQSRRDLLPKAVPRGLPFLQVVYVYEHVHGMLEDPNSDITCCKIGLKDQGFDQLSDSSPAVQVELLVIVGLLLPLTDRPAAEFERTNSTGAPPLCYEVSGVEDHLDLAAVLLLAYVDVGERLPNILGSAGAPAERASPPSGPCSASLQSQPLDFGSLSTTLASLQGRARRQLLLEAV